MQPLQRFDSLRQIVIPNMAYCQIIIVFVDVECPSILKVQVEYVGFTGISQDSLAGEFYLSRFQSFLVVFGCLSKSTLYLLILS